MSAVAAMKQRRLEHALRGVLLSEEQQQSLVAASHGLDAEWTDWIADLIEAARSASAAVAADDAEVFPEDPEDCDHGRWNPDTRQCLDCGHIDLADLPVSDGGPE